MPVTDEPLPDEVELARFQEPEGLKDCCEVLDAAGVTFRLATDAAAMDATRIGGGAMKGSAIVLVADTGERQAREALLEDARRLIAEGVAEDYHLREFSDPELLEIVEHPFEWNAYDVAAAERLLADRGHPTPKASYEMTPEVLEERAEKAHEMNIGHWVLVAAFCLFLLWMSYSFMVGRFELMDIFRLRR